MDIVDIAQAGGARHFYELDWKASRLSGGSREAVVVCVLQQWTAAGEPGRGPAAGLVNACGDLQKAPLPVVATKEEERVSV